MMAEKLNQDTLNKLITDKDKMTSDKSTSNKISLDKDSFASMTSKPLKSRIVIWFKWLGYLVVSFYLAIWIFSPFVAQYFLADLLEDKFNLHLAEQTSIRYNPFTSHLRVKNLALVRHVNNQQDDSDSEQSLFELNQLDIELRLHRLLFDEIYLSEFNLDGLYLTVVHNENQLVVAGIDLNALPSQQAKAANIPEDSQLSQPLDTVSEPTIYTLLMPQGSVKAAKANIQLNTGLHTLELAQWSLSQLALSEQKQALVSELELFIDGAPLSFGLQYNLKEASGHVNLAIKLEQFKLSAIQGELQSALSSIAGDLSFSTEQKITFERDKVSIESSQSQLNLANFELISDETSLAIREHQLTISEVSSLFDFNSEELLLTTPLSIKTIDIQNNQIAAHLGDNQLESKSQSATINNVSIESVASVDSSPEYFLTKVDSLVYKPESIRFENPQQRFSTNEFTVAIKSMMLAPKLNVVEQIIVNGLDAEFKINAKNTIAKNKLSSNISTSEITPKNKPDKSTNKLINDHHAVVENTVADTKLKTDLPIIRVGAFKIVDSEELRFTDESVRPKYSRGLVIENAEIKDLDSAMPNNESPFELVGKSEQYTKINFSGFVKPFTDKVNLKLKGKLSEFALPPASSYIQNLLGFEIESGELDTELELNIVDSVIKGNTEIKIRGLTLAKAENYNQDLLQEQTAMPLNMALGMLKDSDDNVELDIPMLGNIDSPTFGVSSFVSLITKKAIQSAAKSYLIKTFLPYSDIITMTISAGEFIMKTRFQDLVYLPGQVDIAVQQQTFLNQFVALMKDKPSTQVKVCGIATTADLNQLSNEEQSEKASDTIKAENNEKLIQIALQRMSIFKQSAVEQGVQSSRILMCAPKLDLSEGSKPRLVLSV
jgi:hypothetical protein